MSEPFIGEIRLFAGNYAPKGWAFCDGQLLPIAQNTALFSLLGVTYGGDGKNVFALPDLRDRAPMHAGAGPGLTTRHLGEIGGSDTVALTVGQIPAHTHQASGYNGGPNAADPSNAVWAGGGRAAPPAYAPPPPDTTLNPTALGQVGSGVAHNNRQPGLGLSFIIALQGIYPPRP